MSEIKEGDVVWVYQSKNSYRKTITECIFKCVYRGIGGYNNRPTVQNIYKDGSFSMTFVVSKSHIFTTLEDLKTYLSNQIDREYEELRDNIKYLKSEKKELMCFHDREESIKILLDD